MLFVSEKKPISSKKQLRLYLRKHWVALVWAILAVFALLVLMLGVVGFKKNLAEVDKGKDYPISSLLFMTIQLFFMKSGAQPEPVNWQLETARWLSVVVSSATIVQGFLMAFRKLFQEYLCRFKKNHFVICGFGSKGAHLFYDLVHQGYVVIVIDKTLTQDDITTIDHEGAYYLLRDNLSISSFEGINLTKAKGVFVTCGSDLMNVQVAGVIAKNLADKIKEPNNTKKVDIYVECNDHRIFEILNLKNNFKKNVEFTKFSALLNGARVLVEKKPFDYLPIQKDSSIRINLVLIGISLEAEALIIQLARMGHFANHHKPLVTVVSSGANNWKENFLFKYPELEKIIDLDALNLMPDSFEFRQTLLKIIYNPLLLQTFVISSNDEAKLAGLAMNLREILSGKEIPVYANFKNNLVIKKFIAEENLNNLYPLFILEWGCDSDLVFNGQLDSIAKIIHQDYLETSIRQGKKLYERPALRPWEELEETFIQSSRDQADHIGVKLRSIRCQAVPKNNTIQTKEFNFTDEEIELLAKMEHSRWNANRRLEGYVFGNENCNVKKTNPNLVDYENLDSGTKQYDKNAVLLIPKILDLAGYTIRRFD